MSKGTPVQDDRLKAWFLGTSPERGAVLRELISTVVDRYLDMRRLEETPFRSGNSPRVQERGQREVRKRLEECLTRLDKSLPSFSPRFLGHQVADATIPAIVGMVAGILYNQNNISSDYGPATVPMEIEVGRQFSQLIGYDPERSWCHLSPTNVMANLEALWVARILKYVPFAAERLCRERGLEVEVTTADGGVALLSDLSPWEMANLRVPDVLDMLEQLCRSFREHTGCTERQARQEIGTALRRYSITGKGLEAFFLDAEGRQWGLRPPVVIVPTTYQFNYLRVVDLLGLGRENLRVVQVDSRFRMDLGDLARTLRACRERSIPVLAVVSMCGTNLEGAVDNLKQLVDLRESFEYDNPALTFYIHSDAGYGGYFRSILLREGRLTEYQSVSHLMDEDVYEGLAALRLADSVTLDPQVSGGIPYSAAAIAYQDGRMRDVISLRSPLIPEDDDGSRNQFLAMHTIEATRPGAPAVACWLANQVIGLDQDGYGAILTRAIRGAQRVHERLTSPAVAEALRERGLKVVAPHAPDLSSFLFLLNREGNRDLQYLNTINRSILEHLRQSAAQPGASPSIIVGRGELVWREYRHALAQLCRQLGVTPGDISRHRVERLTLLRISVLNPWVAEISESDLQRMVDGLLDAASRVPTYEEWQRAAAGVR